MSYIYEADQTEFQRLVEEMNLTISFEQFLTMIIKYFDQICRDGKLKDELKPGNYALSIINQGWEKGAVDLTVHIYATRKMPSLTKY